MAEHKKTENRIVQETTAPQATYELGEQLGKQAQPGQIYCLDGELGVGKTVFAQGFAAGLGISEPVSSPTFTILQQYEEGRLSLYHFDVYRIDDVEEMDEIGYEDCFYGDGVFDRVVATDYRDFAKGGYPGADREGFGSGFRLSEDNNRINRWIIERR